MAQSFALWLTANGNATERLRQQSASSRRVRRSSVWCLGELPETHFTPDPSSHSTCLSWPLQETGPWERLVGRECHHRASAWGMDDIKPRTSSCNKRIRHHR